MPGTFPVGIFITRKMLIACLSVIYRLANEERTLTGRLKDQQRCYQVPLIFNIAQVKEIRV